MSQSIDAKLNADHAACIADAGLIAQAKEALPRLKSALGEKSREVADHAADASQMKSVAATERQWARSGGRDAYAEELGLQGDVELLERLIAGAAPDSWHGWVQRHEVERVLRRAETLS